MWNGALLALFKVPSRHLSEGAEENYRIVSVLEETFLIQGRNVTACAFEVQTINSYIAGSSLVCVGNRGGVPTILIHTLCWFKLVTKSAFEVAMPSSMALALVNDHSLYPLA
jgi:hypothetical protein